MSEKRIQICDMCGLESESKTDIKHHEEYTFQSIGDCYLKIKNTHDAPKDLCGNCARKLLMTALEKHAIPLTKAIYKRTNTELPYPRIEYKCSCGLLWVVTEGYVKNNFNEYTSELNTPKGKCVKCRMEIDCDLTNDALDNPM